MSNCNCSAEADILSKYKDMFPEEFIESVRKGVSWLCTHNNITYQTSIMVASDRVLYNTAGSSVLRLGLINTNSPLSGLTYYEVKSIEVAKDEVSGSTIFNIKAKYDTPMGITVMLVPIIYFDPEVAPEIYTKSEIDAMIAKLQTLVDGKADAQVTNDVINGIYNQLEEVAGTESLTKLENKVDDMLQSLALDFVTNDKLDEELAKLEAGDKELDLTSYLKVKDAESTYVAKTAYETDKVDVLATKDQVDLKADKTALAEYAKTTEVETKIETESEAITDIVKANTQNVIKKQNYAKGMFLNTCDYVIYNNKVYTAKVPFMITGEFADDESKLFDISTLQNTKAVTATEVADVLKADQEFKDSVKGDPGKDGATADKDAVVAALKADDTFKAEVKGADGTSVTVDEVKPVVVEALKADAEFKASVKGDPTDVSDLATKQELTDLTTKVDLKADKTDLDAKADKTALDAYAKTDALTDLVTTTKLNEEVAKLATTDSLTTGLADKLDTATYTTDKAEFVTNASLTTTLGDYLTTAEADTKYEAKAGA